MKKGLMIITAVLTASTVFALEYNVDLETDALYYNYIKNQGLADELSLMQSAPTSVPQALELSQSNTQAFEQITLKLRQPTDNMKFVFDGRFYISPGIETLGYVIDNAYFSYTNGDFVLYTGKQRIKWGTGYAWNPSDLLQPTKDILEPGRYLEGIYALRMEYSNDFITPSLIISPDTQAISSPISQNYRFALQLYKLVGSADFFLNTIYQYQTLQTIGGAISWDFGPAILNLEGAGVRYINAADNIRTYMGLDNGATVMFDWLAGIQKQLTQDTFLYIEYYRNNWGLDNNEFGRMYELANTIPSVLSLSQLVIKKDYAMVNFSYTWNDKLTLGVAGIYGPDDGTVLIYPQIIWLENQSFDILLGYLQNCTTSRDGEGQMGIPIYNYLEMRLRAYL